jgi:hypothetical protein
MEQRGIATVFFTASYPDQYWRELAQLFPPNAAGQVPQTASEMKAANLKNPSVTAWYFHHRFQDFVRTLFTGNLAAEWWWYRYEWQCRGAPHAHGCARLASEGAKMVTTWAHVALEGFCAQQVLIRRLAGLSTGSCGINASAASVSSAACVGVESLTPSQLEGLMDELKRREVALRDKVGDPADWEQVPSGATVDLERVAMVGDDVLWDYVVRGKRASEALSTYADTLVSTELPGQPRAADDDADDDAEDVQRPGAGAEQHVHPCARAYGDESDEDVDREELCVKCQMHNYCKPGYCFGERKHQLTQFSDFWVRDEDRDKHKALQSGKHGCRFYYPKKLVAFTRLCYTEVEPGEFRVEIATRRNNRFLNSHNPEQLLHWRGNVDMQIVIDEIRAIFYMVCVFVVC